MGQVKFFDNLNGQKQAILDEFFIAVTEPEISVMNFWLTPREQIVGSQADRRNFYLIEKGEVLVYHHDPKRYKSAILLTVLSKDDFFGEIKLIHGVTTGGTVIKKGTTLWKVKADTADEVQLRLKELFQKHPQIAFNVLAEMGWRLFRTMRFTPSHDIRTQLRYVFAIAQEEIKSNKIKISLRQLEQSLGVSKNSVKTGLRSLINAGILSVVDDKNGYTYKILDKAKLRKDLRMDES